MVIINNPATKSTVKSILNGLAIANNLELSKRLVFQRQLNEKLDKKNVTTNKSRETFVKKAGSILGYDPKQKCV